MKHIIQIPLTFFLGVAATACGGPSTGTNAQALTASELKTELSSSSRFVEIDLSSAMRAREIEIEAGDGEEKIEARARSIDAAGTIVLDFDALSVTFDDQTRFRTAQESHETRARWVEQVAQAVAAGTPVFVRASRPIPATAQAASDARFHATDLRIEPAMDETKVELLLGSDHLNVNGESAVLNVLGRSITIDDATEIWSDDVGDDNGGAIEPGDDNGGALEPGDDNGGNR
ncbi:MAG: hypothetical protein IT384_20945 [Deltaproteobacteria bacterium]|nr:hypothetical protein [Deltaproteobacteria bacterium]